MNEGKHPVIEYDSCEWITEPCFKYIPAYGHRANNIMVKEFGHTIEITAKKYEYEEYMAVVSKAYNFRNVFLSQVTLQRGVLSLCFQKVKDKSVIFHSILEIENGI